MVIKLFRYLSLVSLFLTIFAFSHIKIADPDFWWHLKTGEYINLNRAIPQEDLFSYTTPSPPTLRVKFILSQYWLAQVIFYKIYQVFNIDGIIFFKALFFTFLLFLLFTGIRKGGISHYLSYGFTVLASVIVLDFIGERPNIFSFLFALVLVILLERSRLHATRYTLYAIPFLMLLWSNMHGGFILGDGIIIIYILSEWFKYYLKKISGKDIGPSLQGRYLWRLSIVAGIAIAFSFINPNGYRVIPVLIDLKSSILDKMIAEHTSPSMKNVILPYWFFVFFAGIIFLINLRRLDLTHFLLLIPLLVLSLSSIRYIPFFTLISTLILPKYLSFTFEMVKTSSWFSLPLRGLIDKLKDSGIFHVCLNITLTVFLLIFTIISTKKGHAFQKGVHELMFPVKAADFIEENRLKGKMFNYYDWGGYLIWRLYPEQKVFIDTRGLREDVFIQFDKIIRASRPAYFGLPEWKDTLNTYGIDLIVTFSVNLYHGEVFPIITALMKDDEWQLIYLDGNSLIFMRDLPKNREMIERFKKPKDRIYDQIILEAMGKLSLSKSATLYITMGDAFIEKQMYQSAIGAYTKAMKLDPRNKVAIERLRELARKGY